MAKIITKNSFTPGTTPSGLSAGEIAVNIPDKKIFVGNAVQSAVTLIDGVNLVTSFNGLTGAVQGVSAAVAGTGISVSGATGSVTITNTGVLSINGSTGAITNVAFTNNANNFSVEQVFTSGLVTDYVVTDSNTQALNLYGGPDAFSRIVVYGDEESNYIDNKTYNFYVKQFSSPYNEFIGITLTSYDFISRSQFITLYKDNNDSSIWTIEGRSTDEFGNPLNNDKLIVDFPYLQFNGASGIDVIAPSVFRVNPNTLPAGSEVLIQAGDVTIGDAIGDFGTSTFIAMSPEDGTGIYYYADVGGHKFYGGVTFFNNIFAPNLVTSVNGQTGDVTISVSGGGVSSFNGRTGAVQGVSAAVAGTGISVSGATGSVTITNTGVLSINGSTGAITNVARINEGNTFSVRQVMNAGITTANLYVSSGTTFNGSVYFASTATVENNTGVLTLKKANTVGNESATLVLTSYDFNPDPFTSTLTATTSPTVNTTHTLPSVSGTLLNTASNYVSTFNGRIGAVQGVSAAVAGTGISVSGATGSVTITNSGVLSINGSAGAITNVARINEGNTFSVRQVMNSGITSANLYVSGGSTFANQLDVQNLKMLTIGGDEGGQIDFGLPATNTGLTGGVSIDIYQNKIRFFEAAGTNRGAYIDLTAASVSVGSNLLSGGGGTKTYAVFTPLNNQPPATNYATLDTRNSIAVLDFDATTDESAVFVGIIPEAASLASGLKIRIHWMASTATTATCRWGVQIERMNTDEDADSFDTAATAGSTTNATSGIITVTEITITTIDSVAAGEPYRLKVYRDADGTSGTDDMAGDAELVVVEVRSAA